MNVTDIKLDLESLPWSEVVDEALDPRFGDLLATMFAGQLRLMAKYDEIEERNGAVIVPPELRGQLDDRRVQMRLKDLAYRVVEELSEATNCLKNKPWKNTFVETDRTHFYEELMDAIHFLIELLVTAGMDPEDVFKLYFRKLAVNEFRQRSNY